MKFLWATDLHLDHAGSGFLEKPLPGDARSPMPWSNFISAMQDSRCDGWLVSGDIAEGQQLFESLAQMGVATHHPIYFVLGNHDFYGSSIAETRAQVIARVREQPALVYLTDCGPIELDQRIFLIGEDGWGDATKGDYAGSHVRLNDFVQIKDFRQLTPDQWPTRMQQLGRESADRLIEKLRQIPADAKQLVVLTHVPPFCDACWYKGKTTDKNWAPFFVCGEVGSVLQDFAKQNPNLQVTVLCGHTHHDGIAKIADNLTVHTGAAQYGSPKVEAIVLASEHAVVCERILM